MTEKKDPTQINRIYFLDNLRTFLIFLVVLLHAGGVYESSGLWAFFWIVDDPATNDLSGIINLILDIFVMSGIFFISGFFTPLSLKKKSAWEFLKAKFKRLMIPWIIAVLTLIPLYKVIFLYSRGLPQGSWTTYFHWSNSIWNQNWLWFLPVLFLFDILYLAFAKMNITINISLKNAILVVFILGLIYSLGMETYNLQGWTKTFFLDFQNERLFIYFMLFLLGTLSYKQKIFESKPAGKKFYILVNCLSWIPVTMYIFLVIVPFIKPGYFISSETGDRLLKWVSFHLSLLSMLYLVINTFRFYLNKQGKIWKELSQNSYNVYIIHTIVLGGLALILLNMKMPSLLKYFILTVFTFVVSNLVVSFYRKVIKSRIVLNREINKTRLSFSKS